MRWRPGRRMKTSDAENSRFKGPAITKHWEVQCDYSLEDLRVNFSGLIQVSFYVISLMLSST